MDKTTFRFWGGLNTIGGNIIEIRHRNDRVFFDFGRAYNPADVLLTQAQGREGRRVADMFRLKMIPPIEGLYAGETLRTGNTAVFVSHLHLDHMGAIDVIDPAVPVYMSEESVALHNALMEIGEGPMRTLKPFSYEKPVKIGSITVTGYEIDHDVHGASALLVETPDMKIAHSGDLRMRGTKPELNHRWAKEMQVKNVDYLLMEGTAFWPPRDNDSNDNKITQLTEAETVEAFIKKLSESKGVGFFNFYHRNLERMENLRNAAEKTGRILVFEPPTALLASRFSPNGKYKIINKNISIEEINKTPGNYFVQNTLPNIFSLIDYAPEGSVYIHTNGVPLGPFDPAFHSMVSFLTTLGIEFAVISSSGHADTTEILQLIDTIKPKVLLPWHSTTPTEMHPLDAAQKVILPALERWY